jgi:hypothetical protein
MLSSNAAVVEDNTVLTAVSPRPFQSLASIDEVQEALEDPEAHQRDLEDLETQIYVRSTQDHWHL